MSVNRGESPNINSKSGERVMSESGRYLSVHGILDKIYAPDADSKNTTMQSLSRKKNNQVSLLENNSTAQKTTKIKKNKKKKKKGGSPADLKKEKIFRHQLCECCGRKRHIDITPTNDDDLDSDSDPLDEDLDDDTSELIEILVQENLEQQFDKIDKHTSKWMIGMETEPKKTFMDIIVNLQNNFALFQTNIYEKLRDEGGDTRLLESYWEQITEQYKTYVITRFPLLKDFIENFPLSRLEQCDTDKLRKKSNKNSLIKMILEHMFDIQNKKSKKKNKKKKKKQVKKQVESGMEKMLEPQEIVEQAQGLIQMLSKMKIDDQARTSCFCDKQWLQDLNGRLKGCYKYLPDT